MKYFLIPIDSVNLSHLHPEEHYLDEMFPELSKYCNQRIVLEQISGISKITKEKEFIRLQRNIILFLLEHHVPAKLLFVQKKEEGSALVLEEYFTKLEISDFKIKLKYFEVSKRCAEQYLQTVSDEQQKTIEDSFRNFVCGFPKREKGKNIILSNGRNFIN